MSLTLVSPSQQFLKELDQETIDILYEKSFRSVVDTFFAGQEYKRLDGPIVQVLYGDKRNPFIRYDRDLTFGVDERSQVALDKMLEAASRYMQGVNLEPGELIIIDNRHAFHARNRFKADFDGYDRWLQRLFVARNLGQVHLAYNQNKRIVDFEYARAKM